MNTLALGVNIENFGVSETLVRPYCLLSGQLVPDSIPSKLTLCGRDGFFYIVDRTNDMLISGGFNVYPREVEEVLMAFDGVAEAVVVGAPDEKWGDRIHAVVAGRDDLDLVALIQCARETLASYKLPKEIVLWPELPKSATNRILRRVVRDRLLVLSDQPIDVSH